MLPHAVGTSAVEKHLRSEIARANGKKTRRTRSRWRLTFRRQRGYRVLPDASAEDSRDGDDPNSDSSCGNRQCEFLERDLLAGV